MSPTVRVVLALAAGLAVGAALAAAGAAPVAAALEPVGTLWANAILMTVVPLVVANLVIAVAAASDVRAVGRVGGRALTLFVAGVTLSAAVTVLVAPPLIALLPAGGAALGTPAGAGAALAARAASAPPPTAAQWLVDLVPKNPVRAAADGAMLQLVLFTLAFALATTRIAAERRAAVVAFFDGVAEAMRVLVGWVLAVAPIGVFALAAALAARLGLGAVGALGGYVAVVAVLSTALSLVLYPIVAIAGRVPLGRFARAALPAQSVAFGARSSLAALPALFDGASRRLRLAPAASGIVLPLAVSTFKYAAPVAPLVGAWFVARLHGIDVEPGRVLPAAATAVVMSFAVPGVPGGWVISAAPVFLALGVPIETLGVLIAVDAVPDMFRTTANVTADLAVAALLGRGAAGAEPAASPAVATVQGELREPLA